MHDVYGRVQRDLQFHLNPLSFLSKLCFWAEHEPENHRKNNKTRTLSHENLTNLHKTGL